MSLFSSLATITSGRLAYLHWAPVTFTGGQDFNLASSINPRNGHTLQQVSVLTVSQSTIALHNCAFGIIVVHSENSKFRGYDHSGALGSASDYLKKQFRRRFRRPVT